MSWVVMLLQGVLFYALLLFLALISIVWNTVAFFLYPICGDCTGRKIGRAGIAYGYRLFWTTAGAVRIMKLDVGALDLLRDEPRGLIIAANHPSLLDGVLIASRLPKTCCIMKAGLMRNPFLGAGAKLARYIANDLPLAMIKSAVADLRAGGQLLIFPEGTRTVGDGINPFMPGMTLIAKLADAPMQTVFIDTQSPYLGKGWPLWRKPPLPVVIRVRLGERFEPEPDHGRLLKRMEHYFLENLTPDLPSMRKAG
jgi:1-acyl-sn-glycerol-3-phosphate acyltransferase